MTDQPQALSGVRVVEFGGYAAGPHVGKVLGNFGASVVHVETHRRPDGFRLEYPPFKDGRPDVNKGGCFAFFNDSKYGVTLDLKSEPGNELARRLMGWADIVIENMRPGVMDRLGLGPDAVRANNPRLIMLSTCNMGQTGPRAHTPGFGSQLSSLAGFCGVIGEEKGSPMLLYGPYIDFIASAMATSAVLAALERCRRTGEGTWIDIAQYETGLHFMSGALMAWHRDGKIAQRRGNRDDVAAPHGTYACGEGRWIALSCWEDAEFQRLAECLGQPGLADDARFRDARARFDNLAALDTAIAALCAGQDCGALAERLQDAGLAAYPVNTVADLFHDPQLVARGLWQRRDHPAIGNHAYVMPGFDLEKTPGTVQRAAPLLGGDNETVFQDWLGLTEAEYESYKQRGAFA